MGLEEEEKEKKEESECEDFHAEWDGIDISCTTSMHNGLPCLSRSGQDR